ncbi:phage portal protein [Leucobacter chironomi]|uniref:phage portal protein n=1 Tax=Leucobacter chironomi TaxID=491918 RepID=UPI000427A432|nr:phage portal protein [Leucobacter chironomi]
MSIWSSFLRWSGATFAATAKDTQQQVESSLTIPTREARGYISADTALTLGSVYRAVDIHATSARQVRLQVERGGIVIPTPPLIEEPCQGMSLGDFMEYTTVSLYTTGDAFWETVRAPQAGGLGPVVDVRPIHPHEVRVIQHRGKPDTYTWRGGEYDHTRIRHLKRLRVPGHAHGLGPIQAANVEFSGALDARDYGASWFTESATPEGILTTEQQIDGPLAQTYKDHWFGETADGEPIEGHDPRRLKVLGSGLKYQPILLKPADVQFLESQSFTTTQIARIMGIPPALFLAAVEGTSDTYSNIEQDLTIYVRFSLMKVLSEIEDALTKLTPRGQKVRCNVESLLRADTKTRYESHRSALDGGWKTPDEVRAHEGLPPLTEEQRAQLERIPRPVPTTGGTK